MMIYRIGDMVRFKGDRREPITGRVINKSVRKKSGGGADVRLTIAAAGTYYVRSTNQVTAVMEGMRRPYSRRPDDLLAGVLRRKDGQSY